MARCTWRAVILPGQIEEYERRHAEIWPEMSRVLNQAGVRNYTVWRDGSDLFGYYECDDADYAARVQAQSPVVARWNESMTPIMRMLSDAREGEGMKRVFLHEGDPCDDTGDFTLPGDSDCEALTLSLIRQWGADAVRDSDGTHLTPALLNSGARVYSTICLIRVLNDFAREHPDMRQQCFLESKRVPGCGGALSIPLLDGYSLDQFDIHPETDRFLQVFDRTADREVPRERFALQDGAACLSDALDGHFYSAVFLAVRKWEAISMYNHITNNWGDRERLAPVEPRYPLARKAMLDWLDAWCAAHPDTRIVRLTSLFYNFAWVWSDDAKSRDVYSDWGSYDFTASAPALDAFTLETGLVMTGEDFVRGGLHNCTHNAPTEKYRAWMAFIHKFVCALGRECVDIIHKYGKQAYLFYDDTWIGAEPYGSRFTEMGLDGIIKCVFSGYEARLCANVPGVKTHELRLHPYLFPTGLKGEPTFAPGGHPTDDLWRFWLPIRRALLRQCVDRLGLGGYLHLVEPFLDFQSDMDILLSQFRQLKRLHAHGAPRALPYRVGVLTAWGALRTFTCSGHLHEHPEIDLTHILEALSGLPVEVCFLSGQDVAERGVPEDVRVIINAGLEGSAWSGGDMWRDARLTAHITRFVRGGGGLIGVCEPSALGGWPNFALGDVLGVDCDRGLGLCGRRYAYEIETIDELPTSGADELPVRDTARLIAGDVRVLAERGGAPVLTARSFFDGRAVYMGGFRCTPAAARLLLRVIAWCAGTPLAIESLICDNPYVDMAIYPQGAALANNSYAPQDCVLPDGRRVTLGARAFTFIAHE